MSYIFSTAALARPHPIAQLSRHVFWRIAVSVERNFLKSKFKPSIIATIISQPSEGRYKGGNCISALAPKWPIEIRLRPPEVMSIKGSPSNAVICSIGWRIASRIAGFVVASTGKFIELAF